MHAPRWQDIGLSEDEWNPIDQAIFGHRIIEAAQLLRERTGLPLRDVIDVQYGRHMHLRELRPESFTGSIEEYYRDVYT